MTNNLCAICAKEEADFQIALCITQISYIIEHKKELSDQNDQAYISKVEEAFEGICERLKNDQGKNTAICDHCLKKLKEIYRKLT